MTPLFVKSAESWPNSESLLTPNGVWPQWTLSGSHWPGRFLECDLKVIDRVMTWQKLPVSVTEATRALMFPPGANIVRDSSPFSRWTCSSDEDQKMYLQIKHQNHLLYAIAAKLVYFQEGWHLCLNWWKFRRRSSEPSYHPIFGQIFDFEIFNHFDSGHSVQHNLLWNSQFLIWCNFLCNYHFYRVLSFHVVIIITFPHRRAC